MYPFIRLAKTLFQNRNLSELPLSETHISHIRIWPWDIDPFLELNNGRVLTLMDLGRFGLLQRLSMPRLLKDNGWYGTVAGSAVRYRRRMTVFQKLELRTRIIGWDARFIYFEQAIWRASECSAHAVIRVAITTGTGIVPTVEIARALNFPAHSPPLPDWVVAWSEAEKSRLWPPEI